MRVLAACLLVPVLWAVAPSLPSLPMDDDEPALPFLVEDASTSEADGRVAATYRLHLTEAGSPDLRVSAPRDNCLQLVVSRDTFLDGEVTATWSAPVATKLELVLAVPGEPPVRTNATSPASLRFAAIPLPAGETAALLLVQQPRDLLGASVEQEIALDLALTTREATLVARPLSCSVA